MGEMTGENFRTVKGMRQENPLNSLLFIILVDLETKMRRRN